MVKIVKTETSRRMAALTADLLGPYGPSGAARPAPSTVATVTDRRALPYNYLRAPTPAPRDTSGR